MNRIYELRTQMGITMKEAAARLGMLDINQRPTMKRERANQTPKH